MDDEEAGRAAQSEWENRWPAGQQRAAGDDSDPLDTPSTPGKEEPAHPRRFQKPLSVINPATLATTEVPDREWIIPDWLGVGYVTINYAPGGEEIEPRSTADDLDSNRTSVVRPGRDQMQIVRAVLRG